MVEAQRVSPALAFRGWAIAATSIALDQITSGESVVSARIPWELRVRAVMTKWAERGQHD